MLGRIGAYLNPFDAESKAKRADQKSRTEAYGFPFAKTGAEQMEMAGQASRNASPETGPPTADAEGKRNVAQATAEGFLRESSQGDINDMMKQFDPSNPESVRQMQRAMNQAGFTDENGQPLAEDGRFGAKSLGALRRMQGGHRSDNANMDELKGGQGNIIDSYTNVNDRGKEEMYSREGRGQSTVGQPITGVAGMIERPPQADLNTQQRADVVGMARGGAKGLDDAIEQSAPWLANSGAYRGAKSGIKKLFSSIGDSDY